MNRKEKTTFVPKLRFSKFKQENAWERKTIGDYLKESRIKGNKGDTAKKLTVKLWGQGVFEKKETIGGSENTQYYRRKSGQFIYSKLDFLNQAFGIVPDYLDGYESTVDLPCFDVSEKINARFLLEYVQRDSFYKKYGEVADGGRKAKRIQVNDFLDFQVYIPDLKEQEQIANCLSSLDDLITEEDKKLKALKLHQKGLMQRLFTIEGQVVPEWRFSDFRNSGEWTERKLSNVCTMQAGKFIQGADIFKDRKKNSYPCYGGNGLRGYTYSYTHAGEYPLIGRQGALCGNVTFGSGEFHATEHAIVVTSNEGIVPRWLYYLLINLKLNQYATGQAQPGLSVNVLEKILMRVPNGEKEQQKIVDFLSSLDDRITSQTNKIEILQVHKKGLLQGLFPSIEETEE